MKLSILICTMPERATYLSRLMTVLGTQLTSEVEVLTDDRPKGSVTTGEKRNDLLSKAKGQYIVFIDDDDTVPEYYVSEILKAIETKPDCVGFKGRYFRDGGFIKDFTISIHHGSWYEDGQWLYRTPNHISPVKRELALAVGFPKKKLGEDADYSTALFKILQTEVFIDKYMYDYLWNQTISIQAHPN